MSETVRARRAYDVDVASLDAALDFEGVESLTRQEFKDEADINVLVARFGVTGTMPAPQEPPMYGDFSDVFDFQQAMNEILYAEDQFMALPSELRERFNNDPGALIEFVNDEANRDEAVKLGLIPGEKAAVPPQEPSGDDGGSEGTEDPPDS